MTNTLAELIAPNLHVAMIHYPLGMLVAGVFIELFAFLWPRSSVRVAAKWLILLGALAAVPAAFSGIYALPAVAHADLDGSSHWAEICATSPVLSDPAVWHALKTHMLVQSIATGVAALAAIVWMGSGDAARRSLHAPVLAVLVGCVGGMATGAWFGGEAIYKHAVGVNLPTEAAQPTKLEQLFPPVELHVVMAGVAVAVALGAIGLSFRKLALTAGPTVEPVGDHGATELARTFNPNIEVSAAAHPLPASKLWLLAFAVAAATSLGGWFVLARSADVFDQARGHYGQVPSLLWKQVRPEKDEHGHWFVGRRFAHLAAGGVIIGAPVLLAVLARFAPRQRVVLAALTLILVAAVAAQVWFGVLLLYDTPDGPLDHFAPATMPS